MKKTIISLIIAVLVLTPAALIMAENSVIKTAVINSLKCTGCGDCVKACPTKAITIENDKAVIDVSKCINCLLCVKSCNYKAATGSRELK